MDAIRISKVSLSIAAMRVSLYDAPKVEDVGWMKGGITSKGTVHLTAHHLIFRFDDAQQEEIWVSYLCH